jgi:hypothetical protein
MARAIPRATQLAWNSAKHFVVIEAGATPEMSNIGGPARSQNVQGETLQANDSIHMFTFFVMCGATS